MSFGGEFPGRVVQSKMGSLKPDLISDFPGVEATDGSGGHVLRGLRNQISSSAHSSVVRRHVEFRALGSSTS